MARTYVVEGGVPLHGTVRVSGGKSTATKMVVTSLLAMEPVRLHNVPQSGEVDDAIAMATALGLQATRDADTLHLLAPQLTSRRVAGMFFGAHRLPLLFAAPLLHRLGHAEIPIATDEPEWPVDVHVDGYRAMGATVERTGDILAFSAEKLHGADITLPFPSVMATEHLLLAAVLAEGKTVIRNVALEPEVVDLLDLLQKMGAIIFHEPGRVFVVEGVKYLTSAEHTILPDRQEAVAFACAAVATRGSIFIEQAVQRDLQTFLNMLRLAGGRFDVLEGGIRFSHEHQLVPVTVETGVHPGFMTDWQPPFTVLLSQAGGESVIHETVRTQAFGYVETLQRMGAHIQLYGECVGDTCRLGDDHTEHCARIHGPTPLTATTMEMTDPRAAFALLIAALMADGESRITGVERLEWQHERIIEKLQRVGARISIEE